MTPEQMKRRTKQFGLRVIRLVQSLPRSRSADVIGRQLLKAATSVGANYRASCRSRTDNDFLARMGIVEEEADESSYWLELLLEADLVEPGAVADLMREADEILRIVVSSIKTTKRRVGRPDAGQVVAARHPKSEIRNPKSRAPSSPDG